MVSDGCSGLSGVLVALMRVSLDTFECKFPVSAPYGGLGLMFDETVCVASHGAAKTNTDMDM